MNDHDAETGLRRSRQLIALTFGGLLLLLLCNSVAMTTQVGITTAVIWIIQTVPLLLFVPGLIKQHLRTHAWLCFVIQIYFIQAVLLAFDSQRMWIGLGECVFSIGLFLALLSYIRQFRRHHQVSL